MKSKSREHSIHHSHGPNPHQSLQQNNQNMFNSSNPHIPSHGQIGMNPNMMVNPRMAQSIQIPHQSQGYPNPNIPNINQAYPPSFGNQSRPQNFQQQQPNLGYTGGK